MNISNAGNANNNINNNDNNNRNEENTQSQLDTAPLTKRKWGSTPRFTVFLVAASLLVGVILGGFFKPFDGKNSIQSTMDRVVLETFRSNFGTASDRSRIPYSGAFLVGDPTDWRDGALAPGLWATAGDTDDCYFEIRDYVPPQSIYFDDVGNSEAAKIANNYFGLSLGLTVELKPGQYFHTYDCGGWDLEVPWSAN